MKVLLVEDSPPDRLSAQARLEQAFPEATILIAEDEETRGRSDAWR